MQQRRYFIALFGLILALSATRGLAYAQHTSPTVDGAISGNEYGDHTDGQNAKLSGGQTWYVTWDDANLYVALGNANLGEGAVLYIDHNPITPVNGGSNANGNLTGQAYDNTNFASLPFRADFVAYFKDGYREYRTADGVGAWSSATAGFGVYVSGAGNVRELSIPWSAITGGRPAAFNFFAYVTSGGGSVYGQVPTENAGGNIGTSATYRQYYKVRNTGNGTSTKPFSLNSSDASVSGAGATYASLKAAFDAVNAGTHKVNVNLYVVGSTTESAAATLCASGLNWNGSSCVAGSSNYSSVLIQPSGGSWTISANLNGALIYLNGARNVTIDGRQGGTGTTKSLVIDNTNTGSNASTLLLANNASFNTVRHVTLQGASANNDSANNDSGVIFFGDDSTASGTGNDNNTIDNCDIRNSGAGLPVFAILSAGSSSPKENSANTISNNNIANWYRSINESYGIYLRSNTTGWTITGNSFYQTASRAVGGSFGALSVDTGNGYVITGNCIGGQAPACGGAPLTLTDASVFRGMRLSVGTSLATSVQGNTIRNVSVTSSSGSEQYAIGLVAGAFNIGDVTPNVIGSQGATDSLAFALSASGQVSGIAASSTGSVYGNVVIANNEIGGISVSGSGGLGLRGISIADTSTAASYTISGNTIGSASTAHSLRNHSPYATATTYGIFWAARSSSIQVSNNKVMNLSALSTIYGIYSNANGGVAAITNNTVAGLTCDGTATYLVIGILTDTGAGVFSIGGNTVRNLMSASGNTGASGVVVGISQRAATNNGQVVAGNTVHSLESTAASAAVKMYGINYSGPDGDGNRMERNFVHSLKLASSNTQATINGIHIAGGKAAVQNNMVRLGIDAAGNAITTGYVISGIYFAGAADSTLYHNTLWVGGAGVASSLYGSAALNLQTSNTRVMKNNLLVNVRSNAAGSATHAAALFSSTAGLTSDYNLFFASGTGGALVRAGSTNYTSLSSWQGSGQDANSLAPSSAADINLTAPGGTSSTVNLHVQSPTTIEGAGVDVSVTDDFDGDVRAGLTPTDIGADAGAFTPVDTTPPAFDFTGAQLPNLVDPALADVTITDAGAGVDIDSGARPRVYYKRSTDANVLNDNTCSTDGWKYVEASGAGGSPFDFTLDYDLLFGCSGVDAATVIEYFVVAQDQAAPPNVGISSGSFASPPASVDLPPGAFPIGGAPSSTPAPYIWQGDDATDPTNWHVAANWDSNSVPSSHNAAVIPGASNKPVIKQSGPNVDVAYLTIEGSGELTINPGFTLNVNRKLTHHGKITGGNLVVANMDWHQGSLNNVQATLNGVLAIKGTNKKFLVYGTKLTIESGAQVVQEATAGNISFYGTSSSPAIIENNGVWNVQGDGGIDHYQMGIDDTRGTFSNMPGALFKKTGGAGRSVIRATFDNDGTVEVHIGELELEGRDGETISSDGRFRIKTDGTLVLTRGAADYSYYIGESGVIEDFSSTDHGNLRFVNGANVVDGEVNISGTTVALSDDSSLHTLNKIRSLGKISLPADNNASLTLNGVGETFDHLFDIENHTGGVLTVNFATFNVGAPPDPVSGAPAIPKNYTQSCPHGLCTWAGTGIAQVWGTTTWLDGTLMGTSRDPDRFITIGPLLIDNVTYKYLNRRTLETQGAVTFKGGSIRGTYSKIFNTASGFWDIQHDGDFIAYLETAEPHSVFENAGTLKKSAGSLAEETKCEFILYNSGVVDLRAGILNFAQNFLTTSSSSGDFAVAEGTKLRLHGHHTIGGRVCGNDNGVTDCAPSASTGAVEIWDTGTTRFGGVYHITAGTTVMGCCANETTWAIVPQSLGPLLVMDAADAYFSDGPVTTAYDVTLRDGGIMGLNFPDQVTTFTVNGVYRQLADGTGSTEREGIGTLVLAAPGSHLWTGGRWDAGGKTVLSPGAALAIETNVEGVLLYAHTFENRGAVTFSGANNLGVASFDTGPTTIDNYGAWDIQTDADMDAGFSTGQNTLNNYGSFRKTAGSDETIILADVNNKNGGVFAVDVGSIRLQYNDLVNDRGGAVILGLDRWLYVDNTVTNNGKIQHTQSEQAGGGFAKQFAQITNPGGTIRYRGVDVVPTSGRMETTTVSVWGNQHCGTAVSAGGQYVTQTVLRCYEITPTQGQTATASFYFLDGEKNGNRQLDGNGNPLGPSGWHYAGGVAWDRHWATPGVHDTVEGAAVTAPAYYYTTVTGITQYSTFALRDMASPNALQVRRFTARSDSALPWAGLLGLVLAAGGVWAVRQR